MFPRPIPKRMWRRLCKSWKAPSRSFDAVRTTVLLLSCGVLLQGAEKVDFARDVQPILHTRCAGCHGGDKPQGGLSVLTRDGITEDVPSFPARARRAR